MLDAAIAVVGFDDVPAGDGWLGPNERQAERRYTRPPRLAAWRAGRWAARKALAALHPGEEADAEIVAAPDGAPEVRTRDGSTEASVSISHRAGVAAALAMPAGFAVGCDLELIEPRPAGFAADWFTPDERAVVAAAGHRDRDLLVTLIWSAKETALKVVRRGLRTDPRLVEIAIVGDAFEADVDGIPVRGWWRRDGPFVITAAALEKKR
jgi:4'-phosphopantetheinyl transferase